VVRVVEGVKAIRGVPGFIKVDNGPEFISKELDKWAYENKVTLDFSRPGKPIDNAYIELFNGKMRDELLDRETFTTLDEANVLINQWRREYNQIRPHSSKNYRPPAPEAKLLTCSPKTGPKIMRLFSDDKITEKGAIIDEEIPFYRGTNHLCPQAG